MKTAALLLLAALPALGARNSGSKAFLPQWRDGRTWAVEYFIRAPSPAAVENPPDEIKKEVWEYFLKKTTEGAAGWKLKIWQRNYEEQGVYVMTFTTACAVVKVIRYNHLDEAHEVFNDSEAGGYRSDPTRAPLLDWPAWGSGVMENGSWEFRFEVPGRDGFRERIRWMKGSPWWWQAERSYGAVAVKARLL